MRLRARRPQAPGRGAVVATYAAVLDGAHLWLDVPAPVAVRESGSGGATAIDLGEHPYDLTGLRAGSYDVLAGGAPVELATEPGRPLTRTPLAPDGTTRWEVTRAEGSRLVLVGRTLPATAELDTVDLRESRIHLRVRPYDGVEPGSHLLLLDTEDRVLSILPVTAHHGLLEALVGADDLPAGYFGVLRVGVGTESSWSRVRRRADDLADANHAVLLPELHEGEAVRARLRWNPDGLLALRSIGPSSIPDGDGSPR